MVLASLALYAWPYYFSKPYIVISILGKSIEGIDLSCQCTIKIWKNLDTQKCNYHKIGRICYYLTVSCIQDIYAEWQNVIWSTLFTQMKEQSDQGVTFFTLNNTNLSKQLGPLPYLPELWIKTFLCTDLQISFVFSHYSKCFWNVASKTDTVKLLILQLLIFAFCRSHVSSHRLIFAFLYLVPLAIMEVLNFRGDLFLR